MLKTTTSGLLLLVALAAAAETPSVPATYVTHGDTQKFLKALPSNAVSDKPITIVTGGTMPNAKAMAPGSTNMHPQVEGGEPRRV
jgi:hypothetical protein